jgi:hypothetical protein
MSSRRAADSLAHPATCIFTAEKEKLINEEQTITDTEEVPTVHAAGRGPRGEQRFADKRVVRVLQREPSRLRRERCDTKTKLLRLVYLFLHEHGAIGAPLVEPELSGSSMMSLTRSWSASRSLCACASRLAARLVRASAV